MLLQTPSTSSISMAPQPMSNRPFSATNAPGGQGNRPPSRVPPTMTPGMMGQMPPASALPQSFFANTYNWLDQFGMGNYSPAGSSANSVMSHMSIPESDMASVMSQMTNTSLMFPPYQQLRNAGTPLPPSAPLQPQLAELKPLSIQPMTPSSCSVGAVTPGGSGMENLTPQLLQQKELYKGRIQESIRFWSDNSYKAHARQRIYKYSYEQSPIPSQTKLNFGATREQIIELIAKVRTAIIGIYQSIASDSKDAQAAQSEIKQLAMLLLVFITDHSAHFYDDFVKEKGSLLLPIAFLCRRLKDGGIQKNLLRSLHSILESKINQVQAITQARLRSEDVWRTATESLTEFVIEKSISLKQYENNRKRFLCHLRSHAKEMSCCAENLSLILIKTTDTRTREDKDKAWKNVLRMLRIDNEGRSPVIEKFIELVFNILLNSPRPRENESCMEAVCTAAFATARFIRIAIRFCGENAIVVEKTINACNGIQRISCKLDIIREYPTREDLAEALFYLMEQAISLPASKESMTEVIPRVMDILKTCPNLATVVKQHALGFLSNVTTNHIINKQTFVKFYAFEYLAKELVTLNSKTSAFTPVEIETIDNAALCLCNVLPLKIDTAAEGYRNEPLRSNEFRMTVLAILLRGPWILRRRMLKLLDLLVVNMKSVFLSGFSALVETNAKMSIPQILFKQLERQEGMTDEELRESIVLTCNVLSHSMTEDAVLCESIPFSILESRLFVSVLSDCCRVDEFLPQVLGPILALIEKAVDYSTARSVLPSSAFTNAISNDSALFEELSNNQYIDISKPAQNILQRLAPPESSNLLASIFASSYEAGEMDTS